jgi:hypothetical protein
MKAKLFSLFKKNPSYTPKSVILKQMTEPRPLPMGRDDFHVWADRIISGTLLPESHIENFKSKEIFHESLKYALATMLMHLGPTESHKPDTYFIHSLRKSAVNQIADTIRKEIFEAGKKRTEMQEAMDKYEANSDV